jgi:hypothetical protein
VRPQQMRIADDDATTLDTPPVCDVRHPQNGQRT